MEFDSLLTRVAQGLITQKFSIATAESCTGGLLAHYLTSISGSSTYFERGIVSYSNTAKQELLGVKKTTLEKYGAVSKHTAKEMAIGIRTKAKTNVGISTTGIAGPTGGTAEKPVGLVFIGIATPTGNLVARHQFTGDRLEIKKQTCYAALQLLLTAITKKDR